MRKVVIAGGTGSIGSNLVRRLVHEGCSVVVLTRGPNRKELSQSPVSYMTWDAKKEGTWTSAFEGADAIINLVGESIGGRRWSDRQKKRILHSRIDSTAAIVTTVRTMRIRPAVLINISAVGYYGNTGDEEVSDDGPQGSGFLSETVARWEEEARKIESLGIRIVLPRLGVVLGRGAEALNRITLPFKLFVGGPIGSGSQWFPWVHVDDVANAILFLMRNENLYGPFNVTAPGRVRMKEFCEILGKSLRRPSWLPVPSFSLKLLLGEMSDIILSGQCVVPEKLNKAGFIFDYPDLRAALGEVFSDSAVRNEVIKATVPGD